MKSFEERLNELSGRKTAKRRGLRILSWLLSRLRTFRPDISDWLAFVILAMVAFVLFFPDTTLLLVFAVVGLPLLFVPWLLIFVLVGQPLYWGLRTALFRVPRLLLWPLAYLIATGGLVLIGAGLNQWARSDVAGLIAHDHRNLVPLPERAVFFLPTESSECSDLCLRLLLSGKARAVLQADHRDNKQSSDLTRWAATEWRIEHTASACPEARMERQGRRIEGEPEGFSAVKLMRQRLAEGDCLLSRPATGGQADVIWQVDDALRKQRRGGPGLGPGAVTAQRIVIWQKQNGQFRETLRWTAATAELLTQIPVLTLRDPFAGGGGPFPRFQLSRSRQDWNRPGELRGMHDYQAIVQGLLGVDLRLAGPAAPVSLDAYARGEILALLSEMRALKTNEAKMIADYQHKTLPARIASGNVAQEGWEFLLKLAADRRLRVQAPLIEALEGLAKGNPLREQALAGVALGRITSNFGQGEALAALVARLPLAAVLPFRDAAFAAVKWQTNRRQVYPMFPALRAFGAEGRQKLLWLIEDSFTAPIRPEARALAWQDAYFVTLPALEGLCLAAPEAPEVGPALKALVRRLQGRGVGEITAAPLLKALAQMGQPEQDLRALFREGDGAMPAQIFDTVLAEARSHPDCHFALP